MSSIKSDARITGDTVRVPAVEGEIRNPHAMLDAEPLPSLSHRRNLLLMPNWQVDQTAAQSILPTLRDDWNKSAATKTQVAIIDDGVVRRVDVNMDDIPDMTHMDAVSAYLRDGGLHVRRFPHLPLVLVPSQLKTIADEVEQGRLNIVALNLSEGTDVTLADIHLITGDPSITMSNVRDRREQITSALRECAGSMPFADGMNLCAGMPSGGIGAIQAQAYVALKAQFERLRNLGVEVFVAGGNEGPNWVNLAGLGAEQVSATNARGEIEPYSSTNQFTQMSSLGTVDIMAARDPKTGRMGYDITGDGTVDVLADTDPATLELLNRYIGKDAASTISSIPSEACQSGEREVPAKGVVSRLLDAVDSAKQFLSGTPIGYEHRIAKAKEEFDATVANEHRAELNLIGVFRNLKPGLYTFKDLSQAAHISLEELVSISGLKNVSESTCLYWDRSGPTVMLFETDKAGKLQQMDFDGSGRSNIVGVVKGTSFATPNAIVERYGKPWPLLEQSIQLRRRTPSSD